jgi:dipeptidyl aminopeptidase/acylaminoacyl peptidase
MKTAAEQSAAQNPPVSQPTTEVNEPSQQTTVNQPEDTNAMKPKQPPACTFPLADIATPESTPENYTFSEPQVVYAPNADETNVEIVEWLPDNQRVLVVQNYNSNKQTIELFTPETGERQVYATRSVTMQPPSWNQELDAVVYPAMNILSIVKHHLNFTRQAWISYGDPQSTQLIADNLVQFSVAVRPDNGQIAFLLDKKMSKRNGAKEISFMPFDITQWEYRKMRKGALPYDMAWRPGTSQIFLYNSADGASGYTFLLDVDTGSICELDLGGWAVVARWSPNGRYLAIDRSQVVSDGSVGSTVLTVLDAETGEQYTKEVVSQEWKEIRAVSGLAWAPDNRHLLVLGSALSFPHCAGNCNDVTKLYLVDFLLGQVEPILPDYQFTPNISSTNLAWSQDGSKVIALCPARCVISVQRNGQ